MFDGGKGLDTAKFEYQAGSFPPPSDGVTIDLGTGKGTNPFGGVLKFKSVENINGTANSDMITGSKAANILYGGLGGDDVIKGLGGDDVISVALEHQNINSLDADGGTGKNTLYVDVSSGPASNVLDLNNAANNTGGFAQRIFMNFQTVVFNDFGMKEFSSISVIGTEADERITTSKGNDTLDGGGHNILTGGAGADVFIYSEGNDVVTDFNAAEGDVWVGNWPV